MMIREDLLLIVGEDATHLFDFFGVDELHGLNMLDCERRIAEGGTYIDGMCNQVPGSTHHYIFINKSALRTDAIRNYALVFHEATHYAFETYWDSLREDEEKLISLAEQVAIEICERLK